MKRTWITDGHNNRCFVEYWGSKEAAQKALNSLSDCSGCSDYGLTTSVKILTVPVIPNIHKVVYEAASRPKALAMETWHTCENTHCRAGWVVTLAGEEGRNLEARFDTLLAAMKIYDASDPNYRINPCRFFNDNDAALEDMRKLANR